MQILIQFWCHTDGIVQILVMDIREYIGAHDIGFSAEFCARDMNYNDLLWCILHSPNYEICDSNSTYWSIFNVWDCFITVTMYSEWISHSCEIDASADSSANNTLKSYTPEVGRQVVMAIIQPLMESLNNKEGGSCKLNSHEEVDNASNRTQLNTSITRPYGDTIVYRDLPELSQPTILCQKISIRSYLINTRSLLSTFLCFVCATLYRKSHNF